MKKKITLGIIACVFIIGTFTLFLTRDNDTPLNVANDKDEHEEFKQLTADKQLERLDSLAINQTIEQNLNNSPFISTITHSPKARSHFIQDEVIVKFKDHLGESDIEKISEATNSWLVKKLDTTYIFKSKDKHVSVMGSYFSNRDDVLYVEPNFIYMQNQPNDMFYQDYQWNLPMIRTVEGWNISTGSEKVLIAVIDSGVDLDHPDLAHRLTEGYNAVDKDSPPNDDNGHGTHVAGIIASETNNREGVAGITWHNKIIPVKVIGTEGYGTSFDVADGVRWAADHGADIINMSLGNYQHSDVMKEAVNYAYKKGVVIIAATGNDNTDQPSFPAAYPEVLSVSAINGQRSRAEFSNYGAYVDVVAPGVSIPSTYPGQQYAALSGTSMAAPHVAALAGLIISLNPDMSNKEIIQVIRETAVDLGEPGTDIYYGKGLINIEAALEGTYREKYPLGKLSEWLEILY